jgi:hypothetical protein
MKWFRKQPTAEDRRTQSPEPDPTRPPDAAEREQMERRLTYLEIQVEVLARKELR